MIMAITINGNDFLFGRGGKNCKHEGNQKLRSVARAYKHAYLNATKKEKSEIAREIVEYFRSLQPPGRFIKKNELSGEWVEVSEAVAREKAS